MDNCLLCNTVLVPIISLIIEYCICSFLFLHSLTIHIFSLVSFLTLQKGDYLKLKCLSLCEILVSQGDESKTKSPKLYSMEKLCTRRFHGQTFEKYYLPMSPLKYTDITKDSDKCLLSKESCFEL